MRFEDYPQELRDLRISIGVRLFHSCGEYLLQMEEKEYKKIDFARNLAADLLPDDEFIDDDLATAPAIFARYGLMHAMVVHMLAKVDFELDVTKGKISSEMRKRALKDPDIPPSKVTKDWVEDMVLDSPSVTVLTDMKSELQYAANKLKIAMQAVQMKQDSVIELARKRNKEMGLYGRDIVKGEGPERERPSDEAVKRYRAARE